MYGNKTIGAEAEGSHLESQAQSQEQTGNGQVYKCSKPTSSDILSLSRPYPLKLPQTVPSTEN